MVTLVKLTKGQAEAYFEKQREDYYSSQSGFIRLHGDNSLWQAIGINPDKPSIEAFRSTLQHSKGKSTQAFDITISAPKTLSLKAILFKDEKIIEAHRQAVEETIKEIQKTTQTKAWKNGKRYTITTGNFIAVEFLHFYNREQEPQLHSHIIISNMTRTDDGRLLSIEPFNWMNLDILKHFDAIYKAKLAEILREKGYRVNHDGLHLELADLEHLKEAFSTRKKQILQQVEKFKPVLDKIENPDVRRKAEYNLKKMASVITRKPVNDINFKVIVNEQLMKQKLQETLRRSNMKKQPERIHKDIIGELKKIPTYNIMKNLGFKELERSSINSRRLKAPNGDIYITSKNAQGVWMWFNIKTGEGGDNISFIQHHLNVKFRKAVEYLKDFKEKNPHLNQDVDAKLPTIKQAKNKTSSFNIDGVKTIPLESNRYIEERMLSLDILKRMDNIDSVDFKGKHGFIFTLMDDTDMVGLELKAEGIKGLATAKGLWLSYTKDKILRRFTKDPLIETAIIITESPIDTISAMELLNTKDRHMIGIATMGPPTQKAMKAIEKLLKDLDATRKDQIKEWTGREKQEVWKRQINIILAFDKDKAGDNYTKALKELFTNLKLDTIELQVEDARDLLITYGKDVNETLIHRKKTQEEIYRQSLNEALGTPQRKAKGLER